MDALRLHVAHRRRDDAPPSRPGGWPRPRGSGTQKRMPLPRPSAAWRSMSAAASTRIVDADRRAVAAGAAVEAGQLVRAPADDRHAPGLEHLQRAADIQDRLGPCADDRDRGPGQLVQVGRDVQGVLPSPMDAADATGREHPDACQRARDHRRRDRGARPARTTQHAPTGSDARPWARQRACASCSSAASSSPTEMRPSWVAMVAGHGAAGPDRGLRPPRSIQVGGPRQTMRDERGLEGDDRHARIGDGGRDRAGQSGSRGCAHELEVADRESRVTRWPVTAGRQVGSRHGRQRRARRARPRSSTRRARVPGARRRS